MPDGYQTGKAGQEIQTVDRDNGNQNTVNNQHIFVADFEHQRPDKQQYQKTDKNQPVEIGQKYALLGFVGGKKVTRG